MTLPACKRPPLHHHFGSKVGICLAAIESLGDTVTGVDLRKRLLNSADTIERLDVLVRGILRLQEREYNALLLVIRLAMDADDIDPSIRSAVQRIRQLAIEDLVKSLEVVFEIHRPPVVRKRFENAARRIMVVMDGLIISRLTDTPGGGPAWPVEELKSMVIKAVTGHEG